MDLNKIEALLNKYYAGETSLQEEQELKTFFNSKEIPEHLAAEKIKFNFYIKAGKEQYSKDGLDHLLQTTPSKVVSFSGYKKTITGIAAGIALIAGTLFIMNKDKLFRKPGKIIVYEDPDLAYEQVKKTLLMISERISEGTDKLEKLSKINEVENLITAKN